MNPIIQTANHLTNNAENLAVEVVETVIRKAQLDIPDWEREQAITMYIEFIKFLGESYIENKEEIPEDIIIWSRANAQAQVSLGGRLSCIVARYEPTRVVFADILTKLSLDYKVSIEDNAFMLKRVNSMLDVSLNETVLAFERLNDEALADSKRQITELSAPIVPIKEGMAILPFIGAIDECRTAYIREKVIPQIAELQLEYLIADFSGIFNIDEQIADNLSQIAKMLDLLGVKIIVTGLRPKLAQTIVSGGINLSYIRIFGTLKQAIEILG